jgi:L-threonylcarbamoyladenylate synthase
VTRVIPDDEAGRAEAVEALRRGEIVAIPTDTVYGLAAALDLPGSIDRLFEVKARPADRAIAVLLGDIGQAVDLVDLPPAGRLLGETFWPGGLTLVVGQRPDHPLPPELTGGRPTIGIRVPDHPAPRAIAAVLGPLPTTSANVSGEPELREAAEIAERLGDGLGLVLDGGPARGGVPSTVVDVTRDPPQILREGAIPRNMVEMRLRDMGR